MPTWNAGQYLKFADERTLPCRDLASRIAVANPRRIIDLGCGPGNSTAEVAGRWPRAEITGLDGSPQMIEVARQQQPEGRWVLEDIAAWAESSGDRFDIVYSNAALQWLPDHGALFPRLFTHVAQGGAFAMQVPANMDAPANRLMRELAASPAWRERFAGEVPEWHVHDPGFYYDVLSPYAERLDIWHTEYIHLMPAADSIVEWYKGSGLRPFLETLRTAADREQFTADYLDAVRAAYPARADGRVLFPFRRLFLIAYRASS